jgi:hypothetical protein
MYTKCFLGSLLAVSYNINLECKIKFVLMTNYYHATDLKLASYMLENSIYRKVYNEASSSHVTSLLLPNLHSYVQRILFLSTVPINLVNA